MFFREKRSAPMVTTEAKSLKVLLQKLILIIELHFLFGVSPRGLWPMSGLEFQAKSSDPNIKTFCLDPIISLCEKNLENRKK